MLHHEWSEFLQCLGGRRSHAEDIAIADTAFVKQIVEIQRLETLQRRSHGLPRSRQNASEHHGGFLFGGGLACILRIELHVGLRIVVDEIQLFSQHPAGRVQFLNSQRQAVDHWPSVDVDTAGSVVNAGDRDRLRGTGAATIERCDAGGCTGSPKLEEPSSA